MLRGMKTVSYCCGALNKIHFIALIDKKFFDLTNSSLIYWQSISEFDVLKLKIFQGPI
jgi:hypothetical protein